MQPDFDIINDFSKKDVPHRSVYHVRLKTGEEFKCYKIKLRIRQIVNFKLAQQISQNLCGRWLSIGEFPKIHRFTHHSKATQAELDLTYLLHAYTLLLNHSDLWKYLPGFGNSGLYFGHDAVYIFQPWIQVVRLKNYSSSPYDELERKQIVDAYLEMFEDLHQAGLCFYDVMLGLEHREGNIYLRKKRTHLNQVKYQCVWIDVESIMRPKIDEEKTKKLKPAPYSPLNHMMYDADPSEGFSYIEQHIRLTTRMRYAEIEGRRSREHDVEEHGWAADIYLCLCELLAQQYLKVDKEFKYIVDHLMQLPQDSLESPLEGPLTYRLSEPPVAKESNVKAIPVDVKKVSIDETDIRKVMMWAVPLIVFIGIVWFVWTRWPIGKATVNAFEIIEPLYLSSDVEFEAGLKSVKDALSEHSDEDPPSSVAMRLFLSSQLPTGQGAGLISCPIRTAYPHPKTFHKIYTKGHCEDVHQELLDLEKQNYSDNSVAFVARYFDLATCISHLGSGKNEDKTVSLCNQALMATHQLIMKSKLPTWSEAELSLLWMSIVNTKRDLVRQQSVLLDDVCTNLIDLYHDDLYPHSVFTAHLEFAINRCLINAGTETTDVKGPLLGTDTLMDYVVGLRKQSKWTTEEWYNRLTDNRGRSYLKKGRRTTKLQEAWDPKDEHSYYSWMAKSFSSGSIQPLPGKFEKTGWCVLDPFNLEVCMPVEDEFGWVEMSNAMRKVGFKRIKKP